MTIIGNALLLGDDCDDEYADDIADAMDNCPLTSNGAQTDTNGNGVGDACESCRTVSLVADLWTGGGSVAPTSLTVLNGRLYFRANDGIHGDELWTYYPADPTAGAVLVADIAPGSEDSRIRFFTAFDGKLYFSRFDTSIRDEVIWVIDPTTSTLTMDDFRSSLGNLDFSSTLRFAELDGKLYFFANDGIHGTELWRYDPANPAAGVLMVADNPAGSSEGTSPFTVDGRQRQRGREFPNRTRWQIVFQCERSCAWQRALGA